MHTSFWGFIYFRSFSISYIAFERYDLNKL